MYKHSIRNISAKGVQRGTGRGQQKKVKGNPEYAGAGTQESISSTLHQ